MSNINPDDIPEVPKNKFLMRGEIKKESDNIDDRKNKKGTYLINFSYFCLIWLL